MIQAAEAHKRRWIQRTVIVGLVGIAVGVFAVSGRATAQISHNEGESAGALVAALRSDPAARRLYARHFGVSETRFVAFVRDALIPYSLPDARTLTEYSLRAPGSGVRTRFARGTQVWATRSGDPVLSWENGNPLAETLPGAALAGAPRSSAMTAAGRGMLTAVALAPLAGLRSPGSDSETGIMFVAPEENSGGPAARTKPEPVTITSGGGSGGAGTPGSAGTPGDPGAVLVTEATEGSAPKPGAPSGAALLVPLGLVAGSTLALGGSGDSGGSNSSGNDAPGTLPSDVLALPQFIGVDESGVDSPDLAAALGLTRSPARGLVDAGPSRATPDAVPELSSSLTTGAFLLMGGLGIVYSRVRRRKTS
ncbi:MAG: hypothetical protein V4671_03885 [Armatimonadota bacterium]